MNNKQLPVAVFLGLCVIALAVYFGLKAHGRGPDLPSPDKPPNLELPHPADEKWIQPVAVGSNVAPPALSGAYAAATGAPLAPALAHTPGTFKTAWRSQMAGAAKQCELNKFVVLGKDRWHLELPLELDVTPDGVIVAARRFAHLREAGSDGAYHKTKLGEGASKSLTACYAKAINRTVRLPTANAGSKLKVWVRVASNES